MGEGCTISTCMVYAHSKANTLPANGIEHFQIDCIWHMVFIHFILFRLRNAYSKDVSGAFISTSCWKLLMRMRRAMCTPTWWEAKMNVECNSKCSCTIFDFVAIKYLCATSVLPRWKSKQIFFAASELVFRVLPTGHTLTEIKVEALMAWSATSLLGSTKMRNWFDFKLSKWC